MVNYNQKQSLKKSRFCSKSIKLCHSGYASAVCREHCLVVPVMGRICLHLGNKKLQRQYTEQIHREIVFQV